MTYTVSSGTLNSTIPYHTIIQNCCWITLQVSLSGMKDFCQKWKVKLIFRAVYRLSGTGIVDCLEITDVGCNLKQFDGLTWLTLTPCFTTGLRHWYLARQFTKLSTLMFRSRHPCGVASDGSGWRGWIPVPSSSLQCWQSLHYKNSW